MTPRPTDRAVAETVVARLGPDALRRLRALRRRLWLRRAIAAAPAFAAGGLVAAALVQLAARTVAIEFALLVHAAVAAAAVLGWAGWAIWRRPSLADTARRTDDELGLRERIATAIELAERPAPEGTAGELVDHQLRDARTRLNSIDLRRAFRPRLARRPSMLGAAAFVLVGILVVWPNPQDGVLADRRAARAAAEDVAERIEDIADKAERPARPRIREAASSSTSWNGSRGSCARTGMTGRRRWHQSRRLEAVQGIATEAATDAG